jgi:oxygen-independent coproporphyrinogen-3 oxidase
MRQVRWREPGMYMDRSLGGQAVSNEDDVARAQLPFEFMLNALRLREGFALTLFTERCGLPLSAIEKGLQEAEKRGLIERTGLPGAEWVQPTVRGFDFLNDLQELFL